jgi:hypothetical protein
MNFINASGAHNYHCAVISWMAKKRPGTIDALAGAPERL